MNTSNPANKSVVDEKLIEQAEHFFAIIKDDENNPEDILKNIDKLFDEAKNCHQAFTKTVVKNKKKQTKTYNLKSNQKRYRVLFALYEDEIRDYFLKDGAIKQEILPLDKNEVVNFIAGLIKLEDVETAEWITRLDLKTLRIFAKDALVTERVNKIAKAIHENNSSEQDKFASFEQALYRPQITALNPLIPVSSRKKTIDDRGLYTDEIVVYNRQGSKQTAYLSSNGRPDYNNEIKLEGSALAQHINTGVYNVVGYLNDGVLSLPSGDNGSNRPRRFLESHKSELNNDKWKEMIAFSNKKEIVEKEGSLIEPDDYAAGNPEVNRDASFDQLPVSVRIVDSPLLSDLFNILMLSDFSKSDAYKNSMFSGETADLVEKIEKSGFGLEPSAFLAFLMQPEMEDIANNLSKDHQDQFKNLLAQIFEPMLKNTDRLDQMREVSERVSQLTNEEIAFFAEDPNLSNYVTEQLKQYLGFKKFVPKESYKGYFEEDPRLTLINPLIPRRIRQSSFEPEIKVYDLDFKILQINDKDDPKTMKVRELDTDITHEIRYQSMPTRLHPGDRVRTKVVEKTCDGKKHKYVPLKLKNDIVKKWIPLSGESIKKLFSENEAQRRFSLFDQIDKDIDKVTARKNLGADPVNALVLDPHHLVGQALQHVTDFDELKLSNQILEDIDYILPSQAGDVMRKSMTQDIKNGQTSLYSFYSEDHDRINYYWIPKYAFENRSDRIYRMSGGNFKYDEINDSDDSKLRAFERRYSGALLSSPYLPKRMEDKRAELLMGSASKTLKVGDRDQYEDHIYAKTAAYSDLILSLLRDYRGVKNQDRQDFIGSGQRLLSTHPLFRDVRTIVGLHSMAQSELLNEQNLVWDRKNLNDFYIVSQILEDIIPTFTRTLKTNTFNTDSFKVQFDKYVASKVEAVLKAPKKYDFEPRDDKLKCLRGYSSEAIKKCIFEARNRYLRNDVKNPTASLELNAANDDEDTLLVMVLSPDMDEDERETLIDKFNNSGMETSEETMNTGETRLIVKKPKVARP